MTDNLEDIQVVVAGHICLDITPVFPESDTRDMSKILVPGKLVNVRNAVVSSGGPVSNTGLNLVTLGIRTKLMGKIGNDFFGQGLLSLLEQRGVADGMTVVDGAETSYTIALAPPGIDRIFLHNPGANDTFCADDIDYETVAKARLFHFGYPPLMKRIYSDGGAELVKIFKRVKEMGVTTSLDMSLPDPKSESGQVDWKGLLGRLLPYVDLYLPSVEETMFMIDRPKFDFLQSHGSGHDILAALTLDMLNDLGDKLLSMGPKIVTCKSGYRGFYLRTASRQSVASMGPAQPADLDNWANRELHEEAYNMDPVASATGAGDSSIAGFLAAYLNGRSIEETIRIACTVGGQNVTRMDALSGIRPWEETLSMAAQERPKHRLTSPVDNWTYDWSKGIWVGKNDLG
jgi:sugar/nucleoside kinase (ribokinase family)